MILSGGVWNIHDRVTGLTDEGDDDWESVYRVLMFALQPASSLRLSNANMVKPDICPVYTSDAGNEEVAGTKDNPLMPAIKSNVPDIMV
jgi:hypothetical protein